MAEFKVPEGFEVPEEARSQGGAQGLITYVVDNDGSLRITEFEGFPLPQEEDDDEEETDAPEEGEDVVAMFRRSAGYES